MSNLDFPIELINCSSTIFIPKRLSVLEAVKFKEIADKILEENVDLKEIILDFNQTQFIDSSGIGSLVHVFKVTQARKISFILLKINPTIMSVLTMTGLDQVFTIVSDVNETRSVPDSNIRYKSRSNSSEPPPQTHPHHYQH
jgi:anti-anti-sigma factor